MNDIVINLSEGNLEVYLGESAANAIFDNIPNDVSNVFIDFKFVYGVGYLFVKQYLLLKESFDVEIDEINMSDSVIKDFEFVKQLGYHFTNQKFIKLFLDYEL